MAIAVVFAVGVVSAARQDGPGGVAGIIQTLERLRVCEAEFDTTPFESGPRLEIEGTLDVVEHRLGGVIRTQGRVIETVVSQYRTYVRKEDSDRWLRVDLDPEGFEPDYWSYNGLPLPVLDPVRILRAIRPTAVEADDGVFEAHVPLAEIVPEDSPMGIVFERDFNNVEFEPVVVVVDPAGDDVLELDMEVTGTKVATQVAGHATLVITRCGDGVDPVADPSEDDVSRKRNAANRIEYQEILFDYLVD